MKDQQQMLYQFSLFLVKILDETNADDFKYTLKGVKKQGEPIGDYELVFKKKPLAQGVGSKREKGDL